MKFASAAFLLATASAISLPRQDAPYAPEEVNTPFVPAGEEQAPTQVTIEKTGYSGNGCPAGTVSTLLSPDKTVVTFGFDVFQAVLGPNAPAADKQKNCQLHLGLRYPGGYQMSIMQATYHGYVRLDPGVTANFISSYYFSQAAEKTAMTRTTLAGPEYQAGKTYTKQDSIANESMIWSPCGANGILNINNRIALTGGKPGASGEISNDDATIKFEQKLKVQWRRCTGARRLNVESVEIPETAQTVTDSNMIVN